MSLRDTEIPPRIANAKVALIDVVLTPKERHRIQAVAPRALQLVNDKAADEAWTVADVSALSNAGRSRGFRVQSRPVSRENPKRRLVWISFEPSRYPDPADEKAKEGKKK